MTNLQLRAWFSWEGLLDNAELSAGTGLAVKKIKPPN
jgi:hypothetical protein